MSASLVTANGNKLVLVKAPPGYFTEVFVTSNSDKKQVVLFDIDGTETKIEGSGDGEQIGNFKLPASFEMIKVSIGYVGEDGETVPADELVTAAPVQIMGYNKGWIKAENGDEDDDYEVEIEFEGKVGK